MIKTLIEWADHTINFWWGCAKVSEACAHCYAESVNKVYGKGRTVWGEGGVRWIRENAFKEARKVAKIAKRTGQIQRVFVNSMSDTFEDHSGLYDARAAMFSEMMAHPNVVWMLLTKRPENVRHLVPAHWLDAWPKNVWIGTTVENQEMADRRIPELLHIPAHTRFLSCEPLLGPVNLGRWLRLQTRTPVDFRDGLVVPAGPSVLERRPPSPLDDEVGLHWVICGGESGGSARPMHPDWALGLRDQCAAACVPFFFKQWGEWCPFKHCHPRTLFGPGIRTRRYEFPDGIETLRLGKKGQRLLDGVEHNEIPCQP